MSDAPRLVFLEADDEITAVVRRVRGADASRVIVVAPGRSRATSSAVALRLLARAGADADREVVVVGDGLTRSLAAEAGLPAFGSVDEARSAGPGAVADEEPQHASIQVVRGAATDVTVAAPMAPAAPPRGSRDSMLRPADETRSVPITTPAPGEPAGRRARRRSVGVAAVLAVAGALLVIGIVAGATLLPAATITITPRVVPIEATYQLAVAEPERQSGTVEATATVTATGSYQITEPARGSVVIFNWTFFPVDVPAGTFVAAGEQAFATQADVTVPRGRLTTQGTIAAGEQSVAVVAAAAGPAGNVEAGAITAFVYPQMDARLRGFPENPEPRVANPEPTTGGADEAGTEITEDDVASAVESLRAELVRRADEARPDLDDDMHLVDVPPAEPQIEVSEDLAGTRDVADVEIGGSLAWEVVAVDTAQMVADAANRLEADPAIPDGHQLMPGTVDVNLGTPLLDGDRVVAEADVTGSTAPELDPGVVRGRVSGLSEPEARVALADLGEADVVLWPGWVESVPELDWRVEVRIAEPRR